MRSLISAIVLLLCGLSSALGWTHGHSSGGGMNNSPLGSNLANVTVGSNERPFLNMMKEGGGWYTINGGDTGEETTLYANCLDSNNYLILSPATCGSMFGTTFTHLTAFMNVGTNFSPVYPAGNYVLLWDGNSGPNPTTMFQTNMNGQGDTPSSTTSCPISGAPNRIIYDFNAPSQQIEMDQTDIGTGGSPPTNIRLVYSPDSTCGAAGTRETLLNTAPACGSIGAQSQGVFDPVFLGHMQPFGVLRFMKWMQIDSGNSITTWAQRANPCWAFWDEGSTRPLTVGNTIDIGVPYEVQIALCNQLNADCWLNTPFNFDNSAVTSLATLTLSILNSNLRVYEEPGNEWWLFRITTSNAGPPAEALGAAAYPCSGNALPTDPCPSPNTGSYATNVLLWGSLQFVRQAQIWKSVWGGSASRVTTILGAQGGFPTGPGEFSLELQDTDWGGLVCSGCSSNSWTGQAYTQVDMSVGAFYWPAQVPCPRAWTADVDGGVARCANEYQNGGGLVTAGPNTATHVTNSSNACSVATGIAANRYSVSSGLSYSSLVNGAPLAFKLDVDLLGVCDDVSVDGLTAALFENDQDIIIQDMGGSFGVGISGTTLTIGGSNPSAIVTCCPGLNIGPGGHVSGSGTSAGTFIVNQKTGPVEDTITASIATTKVMTVTASVSSQVQLGYIIAGGTVAAGTTVTGNNTSGSTACNGSPCTGSGGTGTYAVSISQTVGSTAGLNADFPGVEGTYTVNNSQTVTCNPCSVGVPAIGTGTADGAVCCNTTNAWAMVYTTGTSAVTSQTPSWRVQCENQPSNCNQWPGGYLVGANTFLTAFANFTTGAPYHLLSGVYEGGNDLHGSSNADELAVLSVNLNRAAVMHDINLQWLNSLRAAGSNEAMMYFFDIGRYNFHGFAWSLLEDSQQTSTAKYQGAIDYINSTPCWWANCSH